MSRGLYALLGAQFLTAFADNAILFAAIAMVMQAPSTAPWYVPALQSAFLVAFVILALIGQPQWILHLLLGVGAINSALAGNAFFRAPAPAIQQEAS